MPSPQAKKRRTVAWFSSSDMVLSPHAWIYALEAGLLARVAGEFTFIRDVSVPIVARGEDGVRRENFHLWLPGDAELLDAGHEPVADERVKSFA